MMSNFASSPSGAVQLSGFLVNSGSLDAGDSNSEENAVKHVTGQ